MATGKQYGLILNKRGKAKQTTARPSVFGDSSDEEDARTEVNTSLAREGRRKLEAKATRELLQSALTEDPTVFEYDTVYDNMQQNKLQAQAKKHVNKDSLKPRYIHALKKAAVERKREQDICFERKVQKEREAEGDMFADKEAFMTSAYKKEMIERAAMEERLKKEAEEEEANDVTKQNDMSRFYQHLLRQHSPTAQQKQDSDRNMIREEENATEKKAGEEEAVRDDDDRPDNNDEVMSPPPSTSPVHEKIAPLSNPPQLDPDTPSAAEIAASRQEQRRLASAKRSTDSTVLSAKDRYLARKKAKLSEPVVGSDDDE